MYFVRYQQPYVRFVEPNLSFEEKVALGKEISQTGKSSFRRKFRAKVWHSSPEQQAATKLKREQMRGWPWWKWIGISIGVAALIVGAIVLAPVAIPILLLMVCYYFLSMAWACFKHDRWLTRCLKVYLDTRSNGKTFPASSNQDPMEIAVDAVVIDIVVNCPDCSQQLRVPASRGRIRVKCRCGCQFVRST